MSFVALTIEETNADSPLNEPLFTKIKDNFDALEAAGVTNGDAHDHFGGDGAQIPQGGIAASAIGQGQLKTATGSISEVIGTSSIEEIASLLPGGAYGFFPRAKASVAGQVNFVNFSHSDNFVNGANLPTSYTTLTAVIENEDGISPQTAYLEQVYIQASPPYKVGNKKWGHFLYLLRNIITGEIKSAYEAEDPPYAYNGPSHNSKDSIERIMAVPHPFKNYFTKDPAIDGLEIVLVDLRGHNTKQWKEDSAKQGQGILENMGHINKKGSIITPKELGIVDIQGFTDRVKIRKV